MEVFGKGADFDPSQDSMVRVYAHNLRQKLEHYYATDGRNEPQQVALARGEYRVSLAPGTPRSSPWRHPARQATSRRCAPPDADHPSPHVVASAARPRWRSVTAMFGAPDARRADRVSVLAVGREPAPPSAAAIAASPIWDGVLDDDMPILVVIGDYYIFGEVDERRRHRAPRPRLQRQLERGSRRAREVRPGHARVVYMDLDLTYLPRGSALALVERAASAIHDEQARARRVDVRAQHRRPEVEPRRLHRLPERARQARGLRVRVVIAHDRLDLRRAAQHRERRDVYERGRDARDASQLPRLRLRSRRSRGRTATSS